MTNTTTHQTIANVVAAQAAVAAIRADMRSMMSLRNPRGRHLTRDLRSAQAVLNRSEAAALRQIMAENPAGRDHVTATIILDARVAIAVREARA